LMVRESQRPEKVHGALKSNFNCLIPSKMKMETFGDFKPISYANISYKLISKIITRCLHPMLSEFISEEQFRFLEDR